MTTELRRDPSGHYCWHQWTWVRTINSEKLEENGFEIGFIEEKKGIEIKGFDEPNVLRQTRHDMAKGLAHERHRHIIAGTEEILNKLQQVPSVQLRILGLPITGCYGIGGIKLIVDENGARITIESGPAEIWPREEYHMRLEDTLMELKQRQAQI